MTQPMDDRPSSRHRGYTWQWEKARKRFLRDNPLCATYRAKGSVTVATVVHHKKAHKGDEALFWDRDN